MSTPARMPTSILFRPALITARTLLVAWAGVWLIAPLVRAQDIAEGCWPCVLGAIATIAVLVALCLTNARIGGVLTILAGAFAMWYFDHAFVRLALAAPAVLLGGAFLALGQWASLRRAGYRGGVAGSGPLPAS